MDSSEKEERKGKEYFMPLIRITKDTRFRRDLISSKQLKARETKKSSFLPLIQSFSKRSFFEEGTGSKEKETKSSMVGFTRERSRSELSKQQVPNGNSQLLNGDSRNNSRVFLSSQTEQKGSSVLISRPKYAQITILDQGQSYEEVSHHGPIEMEPAPIHKKESSFKARTKPQRSFGCKSETGESTLRSYLSILNKNHFEGPFQEDKSKGSKRSKSKSNLLKSITRNNTVLTMARVNEFESPQRSQEVQAIAKKGLEKRPVKKEPSLVLSFNQSSAISAHSHLLKSPSENHCCSLKKCDKKHDHKAKAVKKMTQSLLADHSELKKLKEQKQRHIERQIFKKKIMESFNDKDNDNHLKCVARTFFKVNCPPEIVYDYGERQVRVNLNEYLDDFLEIYNGFLSFETNARNAFKTVSELTKNYGSIKTIFFKGNSDQILKKLTKKDLFNFFFETHRNLPKHLWKEINKNIVEMNEMKEKVTQLYFEKRSERIENMMNQVTFQDDVIYEKMKGIQSKKRVWNLIASHHLIEKATIWDSSTNTCEKIQTDIRDFEESHGKLSELNPKTRILLDQFSEIILRFNFSENSRNQPI